MMVTHESWIGKLKIICATTTKYGCHLSAHGHIDGDCCAWGPYLVVRRKLIGKISERTAIIKKE